VIALLRRVSVVLALVAAAACSRTGTVNAPATAVRFAIAADPQTLDPLFAHADANSVEQQLARLAFEPFIDIDARGRAVPVLLARIPTVCQRRSLAGRPHDRLPLAARREVAGRRAGDRRRRALHAARDRDPRNPIRSREGYDRVARAERIDDETVRIVLKAPWAPAVATLFSYGTAPQYVLPAHLLAKEARWIAQRSARPRSAMAVSLRVVARGERLIYAANPAYWRGAPATPRLEIRVVPDPGTNFTALESGALDWNLISPVQQQS